MPCRIVVADDNQDSADTLAVLLELEGHEVRTALNGQQALNIILTFKPQVALLDIAMPGMDGYEVAKRVRSIPWREPITLIALTGHGQPQDKARAIAAGFDHHLLKPVAPGIVEDVIVQTGCDAA
jgi:two-component system, OmpR family, response regulator